jgi:hypothetical protein
MNRDLGRWQIFVPGTDAVALVEELGDMLVRQSLSPGKKQ